jgi:integrase
MSGAGLEHVEDGGALVAPAQLGAAAERFARNTLRKSAQTRRTYLSVYRRFAAHLAERTADPNRGPDALTADAVAGYLDALEEQGAPRRRCARSARRSTA